MQKPHKHAEVIKAWADGAEIQIFEYYLGGWRDAATPIWDKDKAYRVKPKPKWTPKHKLITAYMNSKYKAITVPKKVHTYDTINQFVDEYETDRDNQHYEVFMDINGDYIVGACSYSFPSLGSIRMSELCAEKLCDMLNNGEIEL